MYVTPKNEQTSKFLTSYVLSLYSYINATKTRIQGLKEKLHSFYLVDTLCLVLILWIIFKLSL